MQLCVAVAEATDPKSCSHASSVWMMLGLFWDFWVGPLHIILFQGCLRDAC